MGFIFIRASDDAEIRRPFSKFVRVDWNYLLFFSRGMNYTMNIFELFLHTFSATQDYLLLRNIKDI